MITQLAQTVPLDLKAQVAIHVLWDTVTLTAVFVIMATIIIQVCVRHANQTAKTAQMEYHVLNAL